MALRPRHLRIWLTGLCIAVLTATPAWGFRCRGRVVTLEDTPEMVRAKCGEPDRVETRQEGLYQHFSQVFDYQREEYRAPHAFEGPLIFQRWTYDLGPHRFVRHLDFENGRLIRISSDQRGTDRD